MFEGRPTVVLMLLFWIGLTIELLCGNKHVKKTRSHIMPGLSRIHLESSKMVYDLIGGRIDAIKVAAFGPGSDLRSSIEEAVQKEGITSGAIISGIGTLEKMVVANIKSGSIPPEISLVKIDGPVELLSVAGNISLEAKQGADGKTKESVNIHLHVWVSDKKGRVFGGSLASGSIVWRQVELVIAQIGGVAMKREQDSQKMMKLVLKKV